MNYSLNLHLILRVSMSLPSKCLGPASIVKSWVTFLSGLTPHVPYLCPVPVLSCHPSWRRWTAHPLPHTAPVDFTCWEQQPGSSSNNKDKPSFLCCFWNVIPICQRNATSLLPSTRPESGKKANLLRLTICPLTCSLKCHVHVNGGSWVRKELMQESCIQELVLPQVAKIVGHPKCTEIPKGSGRIFPCLSPLLYLKWE